MASRVISLLLNLLVALSLMGTGMHATAMAAALVATDAAGSVATEAVVSAPLGAPDNTPAPVDPLPNLQDLPDRDSLIDPPELFEALRVLLPGMPTRKASQGLGWAPPPTPFIEGPRRPPRADALTA